MLSIAMLTVGQKVALLKLKKFIDNKDKTFLLKGSAGTGKTTLIHFFLKFLLKKIINEDVCVCAPTNVALGNIKSKTSEHNVNYSTIHSLLGYEHGYDNNGTIYFSKGVGSFDIPYKLIIIDEASMINQQMSEDLDEINAQILYIGDDYQLPPVNEKDSPVFENTPGFELTEIVRTDGLIPLYDYARFNYIKSNVKQLLNLKNIYIKKNVSTVIDLLINKKSVMNFKFLAYTNFRVSNLNDMVRIKLFGRNAKKYCDGERLTFRGHYKIGEIKFHTADEIKVFGITRKTVEHEYGKFEVYELDIGIPLYIVHENDEERYTNKLEIHKANTKKDKKWDEFYEISQKLMPPVDYGYASTIHLSQSCTYKNTVIDMIDINKYCRESKKKCEYTGITRASDSVILLF